MAIIVPNGYLGNKGDNYVKFREYILKHTRVACIIGFPRFTFKKSGADVSASVLILEKRKVPLDDPRKTEGYPIYINLLESVGWEIGNKGAKKIYKHDINTGSLVLDENNKPMLDADFDDVLSDLYSSPVIDAFPWIQSGIETADVNNGWSVPIGSIISHKDFLLDPKRLCRKYVELVDSIKSNDCVSLLDICDIVPEGWKGRDNSIIYYYTEIDNIHQNSYEYQKVRGWELPSRAKHKADPCDIFIGSIWGSVGKWFIAGLEASQGNLIVTNGCHRLKVKKGKEHYLPDLVFTLSSEFYRVQMRALATGSDGLAEVSEEDLGLVLIPILKDEKLRKDLDQYIQQLVEEVAFMRSEIEKTVENSFEYLNVHPRKTNFSQV